MTASEGVNVREIVSRFQNSLEVVEELRDRLRSLARTDELHSASLDASQAAARNLGELGAQVRLAVEAITKTLVMAETALNTAKGLMEASDLTEVGRKLQLVTSQQAELKLEVSTSLAALADAISRGSAAMSSELTATRTALDAARNELQTVIGERDKAAGKVAEVKAELDALKAKIAALPEKVRSKNGI